MLASFSITLVRKDGTLQEDTLIIDPLLPNTELQPDKELNRRFHEALKNKYPNDHEQFTGHQGYVLKSIIASPTEPASPQTNARTP